ncbi:MAG TPA: winged helix-turn-helix domain-containing protein [Candidatus Acidoferrum sp.]|nr:winged helix-turn-helix domain-containing protein [Candidatus Acidoferrum sp.]
MVHDIDNNAGKLWQFLEENPASTMEDAAKFLKLQENSVVLAAG